MRRGIIAASTVASILLTVAPAAEAAAPAIQITKLYYDSPGKDLRSNKSLNGEYITIKNTTRSTINLRGWTVRDTVWRYTFGTKLIRPGKTLTLRTGQGSDSSTTVYWGRRAYVWNNDKDSGYVRNASGKLIDSCSYSSTRYDYKHC